MNGLDLNYSKTTYIIMRKKKNSPRKYIENSFNSKFELITNFKISPML